MYNRQNQNAVPAFRRAEQVQSPTLPLPPPRDKATTDEFLTWIGEMPRERVGEVREAIAALEDKSAAAEVLNSQLLDLPCADASRHLLLLSTIGELAHESSAAALERFTWLSDERVYNTLSIPGESCDFSTSGMLQSRAVEMMVWVLQGRDEAAVLRVIRDHPQRSVRMAAIDAYLFQHGDSPEAVQTLRDLVSPDDRAMVGLPRFGADTDPETFERLTAEYEAANPSTPPIPQRRTPERVRVWMLVAGGVGLLLLLAWLLKRDTRETRRNHNVR